MTADPGARVWHPLGAVAPGALAPARDLLHHGVQWPSRFARRLLEPRPDDSHSNLGWDHGLGGLVSHDMSTDAGALRVGLRFADLTLVATVDGADLDNFPLQDRSQSDVAVWSSGILERVGVTGEGLIAPLPYDLPDHPVARGVSYDISGEGAALGELAHWYANVAGLLEEVRALTSDADPGPSPVRCWPHHFDIATLVSLEAGDPEEVRAIGVGLAPGDEAIPQPYLYVNPWPAPDASALPPLPAPGRWQTDGFVGAVATADDILACSDPQTALRDFLRVAVERQRALLFGSP